MKSLIHRLSIRQRLMALVLLFSVLVLAGAAVGIGKLANSQRQYATLVGERSPGYIALARSQRHFQIVGRHMWHMMADAADASRVAALWKEVQTEFGNFETRTAQYEKGNADEAEQAARNRKQHAVIEAAAKKVHASVQAGDVEGAKRLMRDEVEPAIDTLRTTLKDHVDEVQARQAEFNKQRTDEAQTALWLLALLLLGAVGVTAVVGYQVAMSIASPIEQAIAAARRVGEGDLNVDIPAQTDTQETGRLLTALSHMQGQLRGLVEKTQASAAGIQLASNEIASGNADLSTRTEQTASNLQQAASSMAQLTGTVNQTADSARTANQLASSASAVAARGGAVVSQVVSTMDEINTSSKKIADIIGTIDGIAFQTNILALNAAVEAARAGEQGRGFAVVAAEVRSLAQRSAEAAREIKSLIGASVDKVESGSRLVQDAGNTMNEIVASVQRVTDIIGEISAAAAEQSSGIGQVNGAVTQLDQMTQQNAALVEQSAAAAESLKEQARQLTDALAGFRFAGTAGTAAPAARVEPRMVAQAAIAAAAKPAPVKAAEKRVENKVENKTEKAADKPAEKAAAAKPATPPAAKPAAPRAPVAAAAPVAKAAAPAPAPAGNDDDWETF
jgi:methyl-accepting chemotaxis protein